MIVKSNLSNRSVHRLLSIDWRFTGLCCVGTLWLELVLRFYVYGFTFDIGFLLTTLFSLSIGVLISFLCSIWGSKANKIILRVVLLLFTLYIGTQAVYYNIFKTFVILYSVGQGGIKVLQFWREAITGIWHTFHILVLIFVPLILSCIFGKFIVPDTKFELAPSICSLLLTIILYGIAIIIIFSSSAGIMPLSYVYKDSFIPQLTVQRFGALTTMRLDIQEMIFKQESDQKAISELDDYIDSLEILDTRNEYTGMFEGKNLIWITAESFSTWAIDEQLTPTLYKLTHSGIVCNNFYNPLWWVSTSDGEFVQLSGLLPVTDTWSFYQSSTCSMPLVTGNLLREKGYECYAYHNHDYLYYNRNLSHPSYGYDFMGVGNGLEKGITSQWPESDLEMIEYTTPLYTYGSDGTPFHVYYLTVSGHLNYNFVDNAMAIKHKNEVASLPYSEPARAYIACNIELDLALESLINQLDSAGVLDDTLIVLSGDHYPYGLEPDVIEELNGGKFENQYDLYHSSLILWNSTIETPIYVDKLCSTLDMLPTVLNLMGIEYDNRLLMGNDIFSSEPGLVIFRDRSFLTNEGFYSATDDSFTPTENSLANDDYARDILYNVTSKFTASERIIFHNYYGVLQKRGLL